MVDGRAVQVIEQQVSLKRGMVRFRRQHEVAFESGDARGRRRHSRVVGLGRAGRNQRSRSSVDRVSDEELELARLVAAQRESSEIVTLHEDARAARAASERLAKSRNLMKWCGQNCERKAGNGLE
jgi:hypothetical protein